MIIKAHIPQGADISVFESKAALEAGEQPAFSFQTERYELHLDLEALLKGVSSIAELVQTLDKAIMEPIKTPLGGEQL